ncbi:Polynucleotide adenylyltransferase region [Denitrovibrio acetiphilus DSM 12809]|uniref:Polynucleotide adenylyltransferase region n=1 Tax=Denitrovibrio acetiphilus (strain DSM 12809 / NBRC 114555 / N2460) TaxID=522772 RepID=D4H3S8_DENA2|nr:polynucleotide adenylyltransferase [Denitrovibrio acetiphilus]ADD69180.1 Polynucleotide adenylyltransferase region [Denitrovibrio acetiphilus DSM 12809]
MYNNLLKIPFFYELKKVMLEGGYDAYFVGGCVRDILLDREIQDIDFVCFSHDYKEFATAVKEAVPSVWVEFKDNIRLVRGNTEIDISKPRGETLEEDLQMRDFTINNLAMDTGGNIFGDRTDLDSKVIRHISESTFRDDPLRILRSFRFMAQLGFTASDATFEKMRQEKELLSQSASERIFNELDKLFKGDYACDSLRQMEETGVFSIITGGMSLDAYDEMAACAGRGLVFFASSLFCRLSVEEKNKLAGKLNFPNSMKKKAERISVFTKELAELLKNSDDTAIRKLIYKYPDELDDGIRLYIIRSGCDGVDQCRVEDDEFRVMSQLPYINFNLPERLNGAVLQELGVAPGPMMGEILKEVKPLMASGELNTLDKAAEYIKEKYL